MSLTPKQRREALEKGLAVSLTKDDTKYLNPNPKAAVGLFAKEENKVLTEPTLPADGRPEALPADRLPNAPYRQTVDRKHYRQTVSPNDTLHYRQTGSEINSHPPLSLPADRTPVAEETGPETAVKFIPLAPVQWAIWQALRQADEQQVVTSYRKLAVAANATIRGVRDALRVIEKEGGIRSKATVRTPDEQGMRVKINAEKPFKLTSLSEAKGIVKRGANYRQTVDRKTAMLPSDGLRLSVCINNFIKQTDIAELLRGLPAQWNIRERTLVEIARQFPTMTVLEFRRSLSHLVQQAARSQQTITNHNAWLKAAFIRNEGPLVTERMIEAQLDALGLSAKNTGAKPESKSAEEDSVAVEYDALRRYIAADSETKLAIEAAAEQRSSAALRMVPPDKHGEIRQHALIEAAREYFEKKI